MLWRGVWIIIVWSSLVTTAMAGELSGFIAAELRGFFDRPTLEGQDDRPIEPSLLLQPEYRYAWNNDKDRFTIVPFARLDYEDTRRRHVDLRELHWLHVATPWEVLVGVGKVFWGVTESLHLVDMINQTDLVDEPDAEEKLGQPMLRLARTQDWGTLTLFVLPYFRERTFPGRQERLRAFLPVDTNQAVYESALAEWHPDLALRWRHTIGSVDIGVAHFWGTGREPRLVLGFDDAFRPVLIPHYDIIHQTSLDMQVTLGSWLLKLEAIMRAGQGRRFGALVAGFEYTFFSVFETAIDVGLLAEYLFDGRSKVAPPTVFEDDIFVGVRVGLNDVQSTTLLAGAIVDRHTQATIISVEASRRLGDRWTLELEGRFFLNTAPTDLLHSLRRDDYLQIRLAWHL